jgi:hypothetical protein
VGKNSEEGVWWAAASAAAQEQGAILQGSVSEGPHCEVSRAGQAVPAR